MSSTNFINSLRDLSSNAYEKHCYVTGGSTGLGLSVAQELTRAGAHVSIVARDEGRLTTALKSLEVRSNTVAYILLSCI